MRNGRRPNGPASGWPTPDMQTGKKMAYNEVLQFARKLLADGPEK